MITATKAPRKSPAPRGQAFHRECAAHAIGGLVASQAEHILHAHRSDYEKAIRSYCRTAFEIADEMARRAAA
jgi:hypothetical protein